MLSVGLLYSAQEFLSFVNKNTIVGEEFKHLGSRFVLAPAGDVFSLSLRCNWAQIDSKGVLLLTTRGNDILQQETAVLMLRHQLKDIIHVCQPAWAAKMRAGRSEIRRFLPEDVSQVFREAELFDGQDDDVVDWWDDLARIVSVEKSSEAMRIGRAAERFSIAYERQRTGIEPHWQSLESNYSGFDILSVIAPDNSTKIRIEVKGTELHINEAYFSLTRNEWETATTTAVYRFHLWMLRGKTRLIDLDYTEVEQHIPVNRGNGKWEVVRIPFRVFQDKAVEVAD